MRLQTGLNDMVMELFHVEGLFRLLYSSCEKAVVSGSQKHCIEQMENGICKYLPDWAAGHDRQK
jgi:hypothetical protein